MSKSEAKRQKQLAKKKARRGEKRNAIARATSKDPTVRFAGAQYWPIDEARVATRLWEVGIGHVLISRRMPDGHLGVGIFLVDVYCLGVKDAFWRIVTPSEKMEMIERMALQSPTERVAPEYAVKLLQDAIAFARKFGLHSHAGYRTASLLFQGIDPSLCKDTFEFGKDGKPFYVRGPRESIKQAEAIARIVHAEGGHYLVGGAPSEFDFVDELEFDEDDQDDSNDDDMAPRRLGGS